MLYFSFWALFLEIISRLFDYSNADKFSRHLIIRIPKTAFKDNLHVGAFVAEVCLTGT